MNSCAIQGVSKLSQALLTELRVENSMSVFSMSLKHASHVLQLFFCLLDKNKFLEVGLFKNNLSGVNK